MNESLTKLALQAERCLRSGQIEDGINAYQQLLAARPDLPDSWYNLAYLQRCARRFEEALVSYQKALDHSVRAPEEVHLNRAAILSEHLERSAPAESELKAALKLNPNFILAWLNLGNLYEDWGDSAQARAAYASALEIAPMNGRALARLAAIDRFEGAASATADRLRAALGTPNLAAEDAAEIGFALGNALDEAGAYDAAFAAFTAANRADRENTPPAMRYDAAAHERLVSALIAQFPQPMPQAAPSENQPPIFICGMFRSGSTLTEQILARHSRVTPGGELEFIPALVQSRLQPYPASLATASPQFIAELRAAYRKSLDAVYPDRDVLTDKRPDNFLHIGLIKTLFPDARIVHTARNPLDNILSVYFLYFDKGVPYGSSLKDITHYYAQYLRMMRHWKMLYPDDIFEFDYDAAVTDPRAALEKLLQFCGLDWEDNCLASHQGNRAIRTASSWQVRQPLHTRSSGRWRNYEAHLAEVKAALE